MNFKDYLEISEAAKREDTGVRFNVGDHVELTLAGLQKFNRGRSETREANEYSRELSKLHNNKTVGKVEKVFDFGGMNVNFDGVLFHIYPYMVEKSTKGKVTEAMADLTTVAKDGYDGKPNNFLETSPNWYAHELGSHLRNIKEEPPHKVRMGRGDTIWNANKTYSINHGKDKKKVTVTFKQLVESDTKQIINSIINEKVYSMNTEDEVRKSFWQQHPRLSRKRIADYSGRGTMFTTDTRVAFSDFVDMLHRDGQISDELAHNVTLG